MNPSHSLVFSPPTSLLLHASQRTGASRWVTRQVSALLDDTTGWGLQSKPVLSRLEAHGAAFNTLKPMAVSEPVYTHFVFLSSAANGTSREVWA